MYTCIHCICKVPKSLFVFCEFDVVMFILSSFLSKVRITPLGSQSSSAGTEKLTEGWLVVGVVLAEGRREGAFRPHWGT